MNEYWKFTYHKIIICNVWIKAQITKNPISSQKSNFCCKFTSVNRKLFYVACEIEDSSEKKIKQIKNI